MNTKIEIEINTDKDLKLVKQLIDEAFAQFKYVIEKFSRFDDKSELNQLNKHAGERFQVSEELFTLVRFALQASKESDYIYDPTIIDILRAYGYEKSYNPDNIVQKLSETGFQKEIDRLAQSRAKVADIELDEGKNLVKLQKGQNLDLGSIGKGYAVDLARKVFEQNGIRDFLINAGGDIFTGGKKIIALFDPRDPENPLGNVTISNQALTGSGNFARKVGVFHHLINPKSQKTLGIGIDLPETPEKVLQSYLIAPNATEADLYATVLFLMGENGLELIHQKGYKGILVTDTGLKGDIDIIGN